MGQTILHHREETTLGRQGRRCAALVLAESIEESVTVATQSRVHGPSEGWHLQHVKNVDKFGVLSQSVDIGGTFCLKV